MALRTISDAQLAQMIDEHGRWISSSHREGAKADFSEANLADRDMKAAKIHGSTFLNSDLSRANLEGATLEQSDFTGAQLPEANLSGAKLAHTTFHRANLSKANLCGAMMISSDLSSNANLKEAILTEAYLGSANLSNSSFCKAKLERAYLAKAHILRANFREADLQDANFNDATGFQDGQFAGANLSGAHMPSEVAGFTGLQTVEKLSQYARKLYASLLLGCAYCWLTIANTTDVKLLTNSTGFALPIIQAEVRLANFYFAAPTLLLAFYFYLHIYLQRLWETLAKLPAVFPDGKRLDEKADPWFLIGMVRIYFPLLNASIPPLSAVQRVISLLMAWWLVPITLLLLWGRYLPRHDWRLTILHISLTAASFAMALFFMQLTRTTLEGHLTDEPLQKKLTRLAKAGYGLAPIVAGALILLSAGAIEGMPHNWSIATTDSRLPFRQLASRTFGLIGYSPYADLREKDVSTKPASWFGSEAELPSVRGASLPNAQLRYLRAERAFLVNADMRGSDFSHAFLIEADLRNARLEFANFSSALMNSSKLAGSYLWSANLSSASLFSSDLRCAYLESARLAGADLTGAQLQFAYLLWADFRGAQGLTASQIKEARSWEEAFFDDQVLVELSLPADHNSVLEKRVQLRNPGMPPPCSVASGSKQ